MSDKLWQHTHVLIYWIFNKTPTLLQVSNIFSANLHKLCKVIFNSHVPYAGQVYTNTILNKTWSVTCYPRFLVCTIYTPCKHCSNPHGHIHQFLHSLIRLLEWMVRNVLVRSSSLMADSATQTYIRYLYCEVH
jgi:hypothetical protein